jgi:FtsZ-binding cell division protein ZapB
MSTPQAESELDSLANLEERVRRTVDLVASLKMERDTAVRELAAAQKALSELDAAKKAAAEAQQMREEIGGLRAERKQVRVRIEKLLGQMDQLSGQ